MAFDDGAGITTDFQFELSIDGVSNTVFGAGASGVWLDFLKTAPEGLFGFETVKSQDVDLPGSAGAYANPDYLGIRQITLPIMFRQAADEATLVGNMVAFQAVWAPLAVDAQLAFQWPSAGLHWYLGRPRGMKVDISQQRRGAIRALLRFDCPNPVLAGP